jgi:hypothetical protein
MSVAGAEKSSGGAEMRGFFEKLALLKAENAESDTKPAVFIPPSDGKVRENTPFLALFWGPEA